MQKSSKELSIIIPCYNVEKYINNCLNSIKEQIINFNYEIILINDCSTDNTKNIILERVEEKDLNIIFIDNGENIGAGASRNKAIKRAKYKYISFIDADDYIAPNFYDVLLTEMIQKNLDMIACDIQIKYENGLPDDIGYGCEGKINKINMINTGFAASPCNKIIKKEMLLKYPFAEGIMNEDIASIISIIANSKKIFYTNKTKYYYVQRKNSVQNTSLSLKRFDIFKSIEILKKRISNNQDYNEIMDAVAYQQLFLFYIYVIPREKNFFKRIIFLKKFSKYAQSYNLGDNELAKQNLARRGKKASFYYNLIFKLNQKGFSVLTSLIMSTFNLYHNIKYSKFLSKKLSVIKNNITIDDLVRAAKKQKKMKNPLKHVSVVIPNYNYERFLLQRIYSILNQNYKIYELIILDDCSTDNSRQLIDTIEFKLHDFLKIKKIYNKKNSGTAFKQWQKGFTEVSGEYIWIAEADDYCDKRMLKSIMHYIEKDEDIVIGYVDTSFINKDGIRTMNTIKPEIDIQKSGHWDKTYINDGINEIKNYSFLNCTIANVSSCIFKIGNYNEYLKSSSEFTQAGDWFFYINVMKNGKILYVDKTYNYYREHGANVTSTTKKEKHIKEIEKIYDIIKKEFKLTKDHEKKMQKRIKFLERVWDLDK